MHINKELLSTVGEAITGELKVTHENVQPWRDRIGPWRQSHGPEELFALKLAPELAKQAEAIGEYSHAAWFHLEKYLIGDHIYAFAEDHARLPGSRWAQETGLQIMRDAVNNATRISREHPDAQGMDEVVRRQGRWAGNILIKTNHYDEAIAALIPSIAAYQRLEPTGDDTEADRKILLERVNILELEGFLSEAEILMDQDVERERGVDRSLKTYAAFAKGGGLILKTADKNRWDIWAAGVALKSVKALLKTARLDSIDPRKREQLIRNVQEAYMSGKDTPGFSGRQGDAEEVWEKLRVQGFVTRSIISV